MAMAHRNWYPSTVSNGGRSGTASEKVPQPVRLFSPMKTSEPIPAASRPGRSTTPIIGPARPATSISRKAPMMGDPSRVLMAAKLPAAPITTVAWAGASFLTRWTASAARPPPIAISGASGPSTTPKPEGDERGEGDAGELVGRPGHRWPTAPPTARGRASPGRSWIVAPTARPASARTGNGHHAGAVEKPRSAGRVWKTHSCATSTSLRKPKATAATGTPISAPNTSSTT